MSILASLGLDKEQMAKDAISDTLKDVSEELNCTHKELFIMLKPCNEEFNFSIYLYRISQSGPVLVREMTMKEVIGGEELNVNDTQK